MIELTSHPTDDSFYCRVVIPVSEQDYRLVDEQWLPKNNWYINVSLCQQEVVSRAANGCPDSIELIAKVDKSSSGYVLNRMFYIPDDQIISDVSEESIHVSAETADGQIFSSTLVDQNITILKQGSHTITYRVFDFLKNGNGNSLFGVHAYVTKYADADYFELDLRFTNGNIEEPIGGVYFKNIKVTCGDRTLVPRFGSVRKDSDREFVVKPGQWFFPKQGQFHRRFIVANDSLLSSNNAVHYLKNFGNIGFVQSGDRCWHNHNSFGPTKLKLGQYTDAYISHGRTGRGAAISKNREKAFSLRNAVMLGELDRDNSVITGSFGPFHPYFGMEQGRHGGAEITHVVGTTLSNYELLENILVHAMSCERQPWVQYKLNGVPKTASEFALENDNRIPFVYSNKDFSINALPQFRYIDDYNFGEAPRDIEAWAPHDAAHQVRYNKRCQSLVYLVNDCLAKDDMLMSATLNMLELHNFEHVSNGWAFYWSMLEKIELAIENPNRGNKTGRDTAWQVDSVVAYYTVAPKSWREDNHNWFIKAAEMYIRSQMPTGFVSRKTHWSQVTSDANLGTNIDAAQAFEIEFEEWAKYALAISVFQGVNQRHANILYNGIINTADTLFNFVYQNHGYPWYLGVGIKNGGAFFKEEIEEYVNGGPEINYGWFLMLLAHYATVNRGRGESDWLTRFLDYKEPADDNETKIDMLMYWANNGANHIPAAIGIIGELQGE